MFYYTYVYKLSQIIHLQQDKYIIISFSRTQMTHNTYSTTATVYFHEFLFISHKEACGKHADGSHQCRTGAYQFGLHRIWWRAV